MKVMEEVEIKMIKLTIVQTDEYANYVLRDNDGNNYDVNINFMGMEKPKIGRIIYIDEDVIKENVSLNYGIINNNDKPKENELIVIACDGEEKYLQRYYG